MGKGKRVSGKQTGVKRAVARRVGRTPPDQGQGKGKATASWTALKNIQKQKPGPPLVTQPCQASKTPRPCIKKFLAELQSKIMNTPASTYNQPRKTRQLPSASCEVYCFWDGACFLMALVDCQEGLRGPQFLDSHTFQDLAQPDDELYVLELLHSIEYASAKKLQQGSLEVAPHALELVRRAPIDAPEENPNKHAVPHTHEHTDPQAQSCKILDPFANQPLADMPDEDFLELLSVTWKDIQEDPERAAKQERAFKEGFIGVTCYLEVRPRAEKPAKAKAEEDPEERLDDDFLAKIFASAEKEVAPAPQSAAAPTIHPFLKEPPTGSSLHKYYLELSATPTSLENGTAGIAATQQQDTPYINSKVLDAMYFLVNLPAKDQPQASHPLTSAAMTFLAESGTAASVSPQQEESLCIGVSVQDAADLVAEMMAKKEESLCIGVSEQDAADLVADLLADFPAKYQPQAGQPSTSARTMRYSDIGPFMQQPPVSHRAAPSPAFPPGRTQPQAACSHPDIMPPSAKPAKRPKSRRLATAPSVGPGILSPLEGSTPLTGPQDCAPATGAGTVHQRRKEAAPADVPRRKGQACAKRKATDTADEAMPDDVPPPMKKARTSEPPKVAHEQLRRVQHARRCPHAQQQQVCSPMSASRADDIWSTLLVA